MRYVWLGLNILVNFFLISFVIFLVSGLLPHAELWAIGITILVILLALSPVAESYNRRAFGCRKATAEEMEQMQSAWDAVTQAAAAKLPEAKQQSYQPELFVTDEDYPNAFAIGSKTVCVTWGMLASADTDELAGILGHELGHLRHGDTKIRSIATTMNMVGNACIWLVMLVVRFFDWLGRLFQLSAAATGDGETSLAMGLGRGFLWLFVAIPKLLIWILSWVIEVGTLAVGRKEEYNADRFSHEIGFGTGLMSALHKMQDSDPPTRGVWAALGRTHPPTAKRIEKLRALALDDVAASVEH